jgi:hypothetical protein
VVRRIEREAGGETTMRLGRIAAMQRDEAETVMHGRAFAVARLDRAIEVRGFRHVAGPHGRFRLFEGLAHSSAPLDYPLAAPPCAEFRTARPGIQDRSRPASFCVPCEA